MTLFRVQQEVDEVLGSNTYVSKEDLEKLEYIEQVLKESLRMYAPFFASLPNEMNPEGMMLSGYHIPGGTQVMVCEIIVSYNIIDLSKLLLYAVYSITSILIFVILVAL